MIEKKMFVVVKIIEENEKLRLYANVDYSVFFVRVRSRKLYAHAHTELFIHGPMCSAKAFFGVPK